MAASQLSEVYQFGPFRLIPAKRLLLEEDEPVSLGGRALDVLIALLQRAGDVMSHRELSEQVWPAITVEESSLRVHVAAVRRALSDGENGIRYITNIRGRGYCFVAPVAHAAAGDATAPAKVGATALRTLPARLKSIVGRDATIDALCERVRTRRFVTIVGPGGIGKTTLAVAVAHALVDDFHGDACFVDLSGVLDAALMLWAVAAAVGCTEATQDTRATLQAFLGERRLLLVLDNCEHVVESVAALTNGLFHAAPELHIIATSREALRVGGENIHLLDPLDTRPSVQLFMTRADASGYPHALTDAEAPAVAEICRQLDGIPLAIELTASRLGTYGIRRLAQLVGERMMLLWQGGRSVPRHQTLAAMLDWSYDLLSEHEKAVLCRLAIFVGPFTLEMAQAVAAGPDKDGALVLNALGSLVDKSLISIARNGESNAYRLLETTRTHAAAKLSEREDANDVARRHAIYFSNSLAGLRIDELKDRDLAVYRPQLGDIRAALAWCFSEAGDRSVGAALGVWAVPLLAGMSLLAECRRWCLQVLEALADGERDARLEIGLQLSLAIASHHAHGDSAEAARALERGLSLADAVGDAGYQLELLAGLNLYRTRSADTEMQVDAAKRYTAIAKQLSRPREIVAGEWMLGASHHLAGNLDAARRHYAEGFSRAAAVNVRDVHAFGYDHRVRALIGYARVLWLAGFPDQAAQYASEGIAFAERQAHPLSLGMALVYAAPVFIWRGDLQIAEDINEQLIATAAKYGLTQYHAGGIALRGELAMARGDFDLGFASLRSALPILQEQRRYIMYSSCARSLAEGLARTGQTREAAAIIDPLLLEASDGAGTFELPELVRTRAAVLLAGPAENWPSAEAALKESLTLARKQSALGWELRTALLLDACWRQRDRDADGRALLTEVQEKFSEGFDTADLRETARRIAASSP